MVTKVPRKKIINVASTVRILGTSLLTVLIFRRRNQRRSPSNPLSSPTSIEDRLSRV